MSRDLILVAIALATWGIGEGLFFPFITLYLEELGANSLAIGGILSLIGTCMAAAHLPAGYLADRFGRKPLMLAAWAMGLVNVVIMAISRSLPLFVLGASLYSMTVFVVSPMSSYVTFARGKLSISRVMTLTSAMYHLGAVLGPVLGGMIAQRLGLRANFIYAAWIILVSNLVIFFIRPQPVEDHRTSQGRSRFSFLSDRRFLQLLAVFFLAMFCLYLPQSFTPNFLKGFRGVTFEQMGQLIAGRGLGVVLLNLMLGGRNPSLGFAFAQLAVAGSTLFFWQGQAMGYFLAGYMLMGGFWTARVLASAHTRSMVDSSNMGLAYGALETTIALSIILASPLAGWLYKIDPLLIYPVSLVLILLTLTAVKVWLPGRLEKASTVIDAP